MGETCKNSKSSPLLLEAYFAIHTLAQFCLRKTEVPCPVVRLAQSLTKDQKHFSHFQFGFPEIGLYSTSTIFHSNGASTIFHSIFFIVPTLYFIQMVVLCPTSFIPEMYLQGVLIYFPRPVSWQSCIPLSILNEISICLSLSKQSFSAPHSQNHRIIESTRLAKIFKVIKSNHD